MRVSLGFRVINVLDGTIVIVWAYHMRMLKNIVLFVVQMLSSVIFIFAIEINNGLLKIIILD